MDRRWPRPLPTSQFGDVVEFDEVSNVLARQVSFGTVALGAGKYGEVRTVEMPTAGDMVAKTIFFQARNGLKYREQVCREARVCLKLQHPNIVACFGVLQTQLWPAIFYERVHGITLAKVKSNAFDAGTFVEEATLTGTIRKVLEAVHYLKTANIVHGDLQEHNVMVTPDGGVKLIDFGLAEELILGKAEVIRTKMYAHPPELNVVHFGGIDSKTDVFFVGGMLYRVAVQRRPYGDFLLEDATSQNTLVLRGVNKEFVRYRQLSKELKSFIDDLMSYMPDDRPDAAQALEHPWLTGAQDYQPPQLLRFEQVASAPHDERQLDEEIINRMATELNISRNELVQQILQSANNWRTIAYKANVLAKSRSPPSPPTPPSAPEEAGVTEDTPLVSVPASAATTAVVGEAEDSASSVPRRSFSIRCLLCC
ncbi:sperm motility kinase Y-like [Sycon ciliatum]|uniref:sperm motility kinase Y-like n=1 Tax=Sycon ciliatum TaxID=27933 RepID=UPI0031F63297